MQEEKKPKADRQAFEERKKKRDHLVELGMQAYDELRKISSSEEAARGAGFRLEAFSVMARVGKFNAGSSATKNRKRYFNSWRRLKRETKGSKKN